MKKVIFSLIVLASFSTFAGGPENSITGLPGHQIYKCNLRTTEGIVEKHDYRYIGRTWIASSEKEATTLFMNSLSVEPGSTYLGGVNEKTGSADMYVAEKDVAAMKRAISPTTVYTQTLISNQELGSAGNNSRLVFADANSPNDYKRVFALIKSVSCKAISAKQ